MVDRDDGASLADALGVDLDGRLRERRVDVVNRDGVVRVGGATRQLGSVDGAKISSLARDVDDDGQSSRLAGLREELGRDELRDRLGEVDAVDEDVGCT